MKTIVAFSRLAAWVACWCVCAVLIARGSSVEQPAGPTPQRPHRLVVLSDIEADPDDTQSLVRLLLYANEIDIEGLVATTSTHQRTSSRPNRCVA